MGFLARMKRRLIAFGRRLLFCYYDKLQENVYEKDLDVQHTSDFDDNKNIPNFMPDDHVDERQRVKDLSVIVPPAPAEPKPSPSLSRRPRLPHAPKVRTSDADHDEFMNVLLRGVVSSMPNTEDEKRKKNNFMPHDHVDERQRVKNLQDPSVIVPPVHDSSLRTLALKPKRPFNVELFQIEQSLEELTFRSLRSKRRSLRSSEGKKSGSSEGKKSGVEEPFRRPPPSFPPPLTRSGTRPLLRSTFNYPPRSRLGSSPPPRTPCYAVHPSSSDLSKKVAVKRIAEDLKRSSEIFAGETEANFQNGTNSFVDRLKEFDATSYINSMKEASSSNENLGQAVNKEQTIESLVMDPDEYKEVDEMLIPENFFSDNFLKCSNPESFCNHISYGEDSPVLYSNSICSEPNFAPFNVPVLQLPCNNDELQSDRLVNETLLGNSSSLTSSTNKRNKRTSDIPLNERNLQAVKRYRESKTKMAEKIKELEKEVVLAKEHSKFLERKNTWDRQKKDKQIKELETKANLAAQSIEILLDLTCKSDNEDEMFQKICQLVSSFLKNVKTNTFSENGMESILFQERIMPIIRKRYSKVAGRVATFFMVDHIVNNTKL